MVVKGLSREEVGEEEGHAEYVGYEDGGEVRHAQCCRHGSVVWKWGMEESDGVMYVGVSWEDRRRVLILLKGFLKSDED